MKKTGITLLAALALLFVACRHSSIRRPVRVTVDPQIAKLSKEQLFNRGEEEFAHKKWAKARTYYSYLYENYPNDPLGRRGLLRVADTYYEQGDPVNLVEAQYKYRDFINRYPGSDRADYAMLQIGMVAFKQMERPDRDQQKTHEAVDKLNDMIKAFPNSPLRVDAEKRLQDALDRLAMHELIVARFYMKRKSWDAAISRLNGVVDTYPNFRERDAVFFDLGTSLSGMGRKAEARLYYERVIAEFPKSEYAPRAKRILDQMKAA